MNIIGVMSGTSLDGLDIVHCTFNAKNEQVSYNLNFAETVVYSGEWVEKLKKAPQLDGHELLLLHNEYGQYIGYQVNKLLCIHGLDAELIASHGHTIFHQPEKQLTFQLGNGAYIKSETNITTVCDFRTIDVAYKGQGAPLVPIGDKLLFGNYTSCLNLGGFANISYEQHGKRIAFDICPVNIIANKFAQQTGNEYDKAGKTGKNGKLISELLDSLNSISFYAEEPPKSLGREWLERSFSPIIDSYTDGYEIKDILHTFYEHVAVQTGKFLYDKSDVLITGGGAFNTYLIERMQSHAGICKFIVPDKQTINYKEAIIFALLGYLRINHKINIKNWYTGAKQDSIGGIVWK